jgi:RNA polymerase-binding transcription factor DksA
MGFPVATSSSKRSKQVNPIGRVKPIAKKKNAASGASFKGKHSSANKPVKKSWPPKTPPAKKVAPAKKTVMKKPAVPAAKKSAVAVKKLAPVSKKPVPVKVAAGKPVAAAKGKALAGTGPESRKASAQTSGGKPKPALAMVALPTTPTPPTKPRKNPAGLSAKELQFFTEQLLAKRRELVGDMSSMEREALRSGSGSNLSTLPMHMADMGTDNFEQEFTLGLVEKDRTLLREINHALSKIINGTYGICEGTGLPISKFRLEAAPWARYGIEYARQREKNGMGVRTL